MEKTKKNRGRSLFNKQNKENKDKVKVTVFSSSKKQLVTVMGKADQRRKVR